MRVVRLHPTDRYVQPPDNVVSLKSTRALAHGLYCQCRVQLNAYRPISKSIRSLRNKLEEADEILDEPTYRPQDLQVLQAATASKEVLERLELALQHHRSTTRKEDDPDETFLIEFLEHVDSVTQRLSNATAALEEQTGTLGLVLDRSVRTRARALSPGIPSSISTISQEHRPTPSIVSEICSSQPDVSASNRMSPRQERHRHPDEVGVDLPPHSIMPQTVPVPQSSPPTIPLSSPPRSPPTSPPCRPDSAPASEAWKTRFTFFDPLSMDIEQASHMILGLNSSEPSKRVDSAIIHNERETSMEVPRTDYAYTQHASKPTANHLTSLHSSPNIDQDHEKYELQEQLGVRALAVTKVGNRAELDEERATIDLARREVSSLSKPPILGGEQSTAHSKMDNIDVMESQDTHAPEVIGSQAPAEVALPLRRPQRYLSSRSIRSQRPFYQQEPRYRVVNADSSTMPTESPNDVAALYMQPVPHVPKSHPVAREPHSAANSTTSRRSGMIAREPQVTSDSTRGMSDFLRSTGSMQDQNRLSTSDSGSAQVTPGHDIIQLPRPYESAGSPQNSHLGVWTATNSSLTSTPAHAVQPSLLGLGICVTDDHLNGASGEYVDAIIRNWNDHRWDEAQKLIEDRLTQLDIISEYQTARRLRHLLGVIASIKGEWQRALTAFISVFNTPITAASQLDAGDCAASYWLADIYAVHDRRAEALLAYSIAERGPLYQDVSRQRLHQCICAEQEACRAAVDTGALKQDAAPADSILNVKIITSGAVSSFLGYVRWQPSAQDKPYTLDPHDRRSLALWKLGLDSETETIKRLQIDASVLDPASPWPLTFDPMFSCANVSQGRFVQECNLLETFASNPGTKVAKGGLRSKSDCTHPDMLWLITTLRKCLVSLKIEWTETMTPQSTWFAARYPCTDDKIATINYFSITIFKLSLRSGYGVEICPGGCSSARITRTDPHSDKGVHLQETKRIKSLVRQYLEEAVRRQEATSMSTALPVMGINGGMYQDPSRRKNAVRYG